MRFGFVSIGVTAAWLLASACGDDRTPAGDEPPGSTGWDEPPADPPSAESSGGSDGDTGSGADDNPRAADEWSSQRSALRRMTATQYRATLAGTLGLDDTTLAAAPDDLVFALFSNVGASKVVTSALAVEQYEDAALAATAAVFDDAGLRAALVGCDPSEPDCVQDFVRSFGQRAWRRPLTVSERLRYQDLFDRLTAQLDAPWVALRFVASALLTSPNFMHLVETGEADPAQPSRVRYTSVEMASRLSYFLWDGPPDDALLELGVAGDLLSAAVIDEQVARMVDDPRAVAGVSHFMGQLLGLVALDLLSKDPDVFPEASPELYEQMRGEVARVVHATLVDDGGSIGDLLTSRRTFVTPGLADLYDVALDGEVDGDGFAAVSFSDDAARGGYLGTGAFLAANARVTRTSPTLRGLWIQRRLLCNELPPPPADVDAELPEPGGGDQPRTMREILASHAEDPACAGCHVVVDPLGLALEHFDGLGRYRDTDQGLALDVSAELWGQSLTGLRGLAEAIAASPELPNCIARHSYRYAVGHVESSDEEAFIADVAELGDAPLRDVWAAVARSPGFRYRGQVDR